MVQACEMKYAAGGFNIFEKKSHEEVYGQPLDRMKDAFTNRMKGILGVLPKSKLSNRDEVMTTWGPHGKFTCEPGYHYTIATQPSGPNRLEFEVGCAKMDYAHHLIKTTINTR